MENLTKNKSLLCFVQSVLLHVSFYFFFFVYFQMCLKSCVQNTHDGCQSYRPSGGERATHPNLDLIDLWVTSWNQGYRDESEQHPWMSPTGGMEIHNFVGSYSRFAQTLKSAWIWLLSWKVLNFSCCLETKSVPCLLMPWLLAWICVEKIQLDYLCTGDLHT